ncbi:hypothetical protein J6590_106955, partial [Homalodisca vitripennis]
MKQLARTDVGTLNVQQLFFERLTNRERTLNVVYSSVVCSSTIKVFGQTENLQ